MVVGLVVLNKDVRFLGVLLGFVEGLLHYRKKLERACWNVRGANCRCHAGHGVSLDETSLHCHRTAQLGKTCNITAYLYYLQHSGCITGRTPLG